MGGWDPREEGVKPEQDEEEKSVPPAPPKKSNVSLCPKKGGAAYFARFLTKKIC